MTVSRLRTGHNRLYSKLLISHTEQCSCGTASQRTEHLLQSCPLCKLLRKGIWPDHTFIAHKLYDSLGTYYVLPPSSGRLEFPSDEQEEKKRKPHDSLMYLDGSIRMGQRGRGFTAKQGRMSTQVEAGAYPVTAARWPFGQETVTCLVVATQSDTKISHAIILAGSINLLQKVKSGMVYPDWCQVMHSLWLQRLHWVCCPGHAKVSKRMNWQKYWQTW